MSETAIKLNKKFNRYFRSIEKQLNKNTNPFGDLQPGNLYHVPVITKLGDGKKVLKRSDRSIISEIPIKAGHIRDILIKEEDVKVIQIADYIGYSFASRILAGTLPTKSLRFVIADLILRLEKELGFKHTDVESTGDYYIKFNGFTERDDMAAFKIEIETCCVPNIDLEVLKAVKNV